MTFEVKAVDHVNVLAVYEALSHSRSATHSYAVFHIPGVLADANEEELRPVLLAAAEHGIGVLTFEVATDFETWDERQPAERLQSDLVRMNSFLQEQLSPGGQQKIARAVASVQLGFR